jgi:hypothetical protein
MFLPRDVSLEIAMSPSQARRAAALGLALALGAAATAVADTVMADGDALTPGVQTTVDLGDQAPGAGMALDVPFVLTCDKTSHVAAKSTLTITPIYVGTPEDGTADVTDGSISIPDSWPSSGADCPDPAPSTQDGTPVHLDLTAPTVLGTGFTFDFLFAADPGTGVTNTISFTATLNVVDPPASPPADTTPPVLSGVPADKTVSTSGTSAVVTWTDPTATDDTDPNPQVACDPSSGSSFGLGTTSVTCSATDASGNAAQAAFDVTVVQVPVVRLPVGRWGRPLDDQAVPALVGQLGRTIPLKLTLRAGDAVQGPAQVGAPSLQLEQLGACAGTPATGAPRDAGRFAWDEGGWRLNLRTADLGPGCWHLVATVDGAPVAEAVIRLVPDATASTAGSVRKAAAGSGTGAAHVTRDAEETRSVHGTHRPQPGSKRR